MGYQNSELILVETNNKIQKKETKKNWRRDWETGKFKLENLIEIKISKT